MADSNRDRAVDSNVLLRRASWCGVLFALAILLTCLNFMPPVDVRYQVKSSAVISETRLGQLRDLVIADREAVKQGRQQRIQLLSVKVLDLAKQEESLAPAENDDKVVLVEIESLWANRCTQERHYTWLKNISRIDAAQVSDARASTSARMARWELEAAQHYLTQHKFLLEKEPQPTPEIATNVASNNQRQSFQLASFGQPSSELQASSDISNQTVGEESVVSGIADFGLQLNEQVKVAQEQLKEAELDLQAQIEESSGVLQITNMPVISPRSTSIPLWMAVSILFLGLATGSTASWYQLKQLASGSFSPSRVAEDLACDSIPLAGTLQLSQDDEVGSSDQPANAPQVQARRLNRLSEWAVTFWAVLAVGRFFFDSVWRDVLIDSPLAALGRIMSGMP